jgi:hypothetical protein
MRSVTKSEQPKRTGINDMRGNGSRATVANYPALSACHIMKPVASKSHRTTRSVLDAW